MARKQGRSRRYHAHNHLFAGRGLGCVGELSAVNPLLPVIEDAPARGRRVFPSASASASASAIEPDAAPDTPSRGGDGGADAAALLSLQRAAGAARGGRRILPHTHERTTLLPQHWNCYAGDELVGPVLGGHRQAWLRRLASGTAGGRVGGGAAADKLSPATRAGFRLMQKVAPLEASSPRFAPERRLANLRSDVGWPSRAPLPEAAARARRTLLPRPLFAAETVPGAPDKVTRAGRGATPLCVSTEG